MPLALRRPWLAIDPTYSALVMCGVFLAGRR